MESYRYMVGMEYSMRVPRALRSSGLYFNPFFLSHNYLLESYRYMVGMEFKHASTYAASLNNAKSLGLSSGL